MIGLARIADRGPLVSACLAAVLLLSALWIPVLLGGGSSPGLLIIASFLSMLLLITSAAVVAFVALRHGEMSAIQVVGGCLLLLIVVSMALYHSAVHVPLIASVFWLPAIVAAMVLARTVKMNYAVLTIVICGVIAVVGLTLLIGDSTEFWRAQFSATSTVVFEQSGLTGANIALLEEKRDAVIDTMAKMMTGAMGISVMSVALGALFLSRYWQAGLFNPGGFQKEFHALSLGRNAAVVCALVIVVAIAQGGQLAGAIAMVVIFAFFIQGLAVTHSLVKQRGMHRYWLHGIYMLLMLPHTLLLLAALGVGGQFVSSPARLNF